MSSTQKSNNTLAVSYIVQELIDSYEKGATLNLTKLKLQASKKFQIQGIPRMSDILRALPIAYRAKLWPFLQTKPVRTASGVAVVAVMSKPHRYVSSYLLYCRQRSMSTRIFGCLY